MILSGSLDNWILINRMHMFYANKNLPENIFMYT